MQILKNLFQRSKHGRVLVLATAGVIFAALFVGTGLMNRPKRAPASADPSSTREGEFQVAVDDSRKVAGFVEHFGPRIDETEKRLADREEELKTLKGRQEKYESILANLLEAFQADHSRQEKKETDEKTGSSKSRTTSRSDTDSESRESDAATALGRLSKVTLALGSGETQGRKKKDPSVRIPAGSFAEATLLTGVYAPTEGGALPVSMRLDMTFLGPNQSRIPIQGAFLIGKAVGDPNSRRVTIQLSKLSYVKTSGEVVEVPLNGYVADADGVQGLAGQYVWRVRETMGLAITAGGISAFSDAAAARATTTQITPLGGAQTIVTGDLGSFAAFRGASRAADELEKLVVKRLDQVVPAIYVANAKKITVCLIDGVTLEGLLLGEVKNGSSTNPYAGLDLDR